MGADEVKKLSFSYPAEPGCEISECFDCGPFWKCSIESNPEAPHGLTIHEWHRSICPVWDA